MKNKISLTYSDKVKAAMERENKKKVDVYSFLGMSPPTFETRLKLNNWWHSEVQMLNQFLKIKD